MQKLMTTLAVFCAASLCAEEAAPKKIWNSSIGAGLAITSGNSDTRNLNLSGATVRDAKDGRVFKADALYLRGEANDTKQVDKAAATARFERTLSPRSFWFAEAGYLRDPFRDTSYLLSPLAGIGHKLVDTDARKLAVDAAAGAAIESGDALGRRTSGALKAGQAFEWAISPTSRVTQRLNGLWKTDDFDDALYHFDAGLTTTIAARAELKLSWVYDYRNQPPSPGVKKGDSALFAAVLCKF